MKAQWFVILLSLVGSLLLPIGPARAGSAEVSENRIGRMNLDVGLQDFVEVPFSPDKIVWLKIDLTEDFALKKMIRKGQQLSEILEAYEPLPLEEKHTEEELAQLRKDKARWRATYRAELRTVLGEQYYLWKEINQITKELLWIRSAILPPGYFLRLSLKDRVSDDIEEMVYVTENYLVAKTIADDLRKGVIRSLTVATKNNDKEGKSVPCGKSCWISAFGY